MMIHHEVTHRAILLPHREETLKHLHHIPTTILIFHDILEFYYTNQITIHGSKQINHITCQSTSTTMPWPWSAVR